MLIPSYKIEIWACIIIANIWFSSTASISVICGITWIVFAIVLLLIDLTLN